MSQKNTTNKGLMFSPLLKDGLDADGGRSEVDAVEEDGQEPELVLLPD